MVERTTGHILRFDEIRAGDTGVAGGKGANLGELAAHGFPVPPGFVVSADACRQHFESLHLYHEPDDLDVDLSHGCTRRRRAIIDSELSLPLATAIRDAHAELTAACPGELVCAVRSSATAEDLSGASFAGQHGTYYNVAAERLIEMIKRCWASLWTMEAVAYRKTRGIPHGSLFMAVVVQEMVRSDVSGVAFTVHPVSGNRDELVIESSWGMGAALVDGRVTPDRYVVARDGFRMRECRIADKRLMVSARPSDAFDQRLKDVPLDLRTRETLSPDQVETVGRWALKCEAHYGAPQDVEWAIAQGRFHLLQSRPITTLGRTTIGTDVDGRWVLFKPIVENFTDPLSPLMADLFVRIFEPAMRIIGGRIYQNLDYIQPLLPFRLSDEELAMVVYSMFGIWPARLRIAPLKLPVTVGVGVLVGLLSAVTLARTRRMPDDFMGAYRELCRKVEADLSLGPVETLQRLGLNIGLFEPIGRLPIIVNASSLRFAWWLAVLRVLVHRWAPALPADTADRLASGNEGVLSADMGRGIEMLAQEAASRPSVAELILQLPADSVHARLKAEPDAREFLAALDRFLGIHGHRAIKEFELMAPRWAEQPATVLGLIRNHLVSRSEPGRRADTAASARRRAEADVREALGSLRLERGLGLRRRVIRWTAERARYFFKLRENSRFYHIMAMAAVRKRVITIEADLLRRGLLKCRDDIFFLLVGELEALQAGRLGWLDVEDRVRERRIERVRLAKIAPPKTIGIALAPEPAGANPNEPDQLHGQSASPGRHVGIARVILDPSIDAMLQPGEVLVAPYTDPAWTPLFLVAGAAIVEVGSYLSHAGTVAREYGMPCIVDVPDCTSRIQTGTRVEVDGDRGSVRILGEAP